ncbi:hypothetical protein SLS58_006411 [Diplodia intermedia]|uniref:Uncharacterized protein n=1 Tax=Diplodia intermedia TaxID=856260 RepID=A0ABR3TN49_9PEZI
MFAAADYLTSKELERIAERDRIRANALLQLKEDRKARQRRLSSKANSDTPPQHRRGSTHASPSASPASNATPPPEASSRSTITSSGITLEKLHSIKVSRRSWYACHRRAISSVLLIPNHSPVSPRPNSDNLKFTEKKFRICKKADDSRIGVDCGGQAEAWMYNGRVIPTHVRKWPPEKFNKLLMCMDKAEEVCGRLSEELKMRGLC